MGLFSKRKTIFVDSDVLVIGGGMAGCGATYESRYWGRDLKIVCVENIGSLKSDRTETIYVKHPYFNVLAQMTDVADYLQVVMEYDVSKIDVLVGNVADDLAIAGRIAERMRKQVEDCVIELPDGEQTQVTISIGLAPFVADCHDQVCLKAADAALYKAKNSGRNRVCAAYGEAPAKAFA